MLKTLNYSLFIEITVLSTEYICVKETHLNMDLKLVTIHQVYWFFLLDKSHALLYILDVLVQKCTYCYMNKIHDSTTNTIIKFH